MVHTLNKQASEADYEQCDFHPDWNGFVCLFCSFILLPEMIGEDNAVGGMLCSWCLRWCDPTTRQVELQGLHSLALAASYLGVETLQVSENLNNKVQKISERWETGMTRDTQEPRQMGSVVYLGGGSTCPSNTSENTCLCVCVFQTSGTVRLTDRKVTPAPGGRSHEIKFCHGLFPVIEVSSCSSLWLPFVESRRNQCQEFQERWEVQTNWWL